MKKLNKELSVHLLIAILLSVLYVAAIPTLIISIGKIKWLMIVCIVYLAAGFYGLPMVWVTYGDKRSLLSVAKAVMSDKIYDVETISVQLNDNTDSVAAKIRKCIDKGYINGFLFDGKTLEVNERKAKVSSRKCPNCGAPLVEKSGVLYCKYCNSEYHNDN